MSKNYVRAHSMSEKRYAYKRLSDYTGIRNKNRNLIVLIKDIIKRYNLNIIPPNNVSDAIELSEQLIEDNELRAKLAKNIESSGSPIEKRMAEYLDECGIEYIREYKIGRYRVDFLLPKINLVIECNGYAWHQDPKTYYEMEKDLRRRNEITKAGYRILYYSGRQIYKYKNKILKDIALLTTP